MRVTRRRSRLAPEQADCSYKKSTAYRRSLPSHLIHDSFPPRDSQYELPNPRSSSATPYVQPYSHRYSLVPSHQTIFVPLNVANDMGWVTQQRPWQPGRHVAERCLPQVRCSLRGSPPEKMINPRRSTHCFRCGSSGRGREPTSWLEKREQVHIKLGFARVTQTVRPARIDLQDAILHQFFREHGRRADWHNLIVAVDDQRRQIECPFSFISLM